jgi:hypothetical protein
MKETQENGLKEKTFALTDHITDLFESYYKLGILNLTDRATGIASFTITMLAVFLLFLFTLFFIGFGFAWWLGEKLQNTVAGFFIVAGIFLAIIGLIVAFRKQFLFPFIRNVVIRKVYE